MILERGYIWFNFQHRRWEQLPQYLIFESQNWKKELPEIQKKYSLRKCAWEMGAFYYHHGLRFSSEQILKYVSERDIIDAGAFTGDSLVVLQNYTSKKIVSYELLPKNAQYAMENVRQYNSSRLIVINCGLSDKSGFAFVGQRIDGSANIGKKGNAKVTISSVDEEVKRLNLTIGLIKADIEGEELNMLKGAIKTIKRDKPILSIAIYHDSQLIDVPEFIESIGGYRICFRTEADYKVELLFESDVLHFLNF